MFTLHGLYKSQVIPLVYGLLVGKKTTDYDHFFRRIMDEDDFDPETILSDFEAATIKSINSLFPNIVHKGCLFHFGQCIWRQIQSHGLQKKYQEDKSFHLGIKKLIALAFVPVLDVIKAFDLIADDFDDDADDFLGYFEKTWIGEPKKRGTGRKKPLFTIELWNVYDRTVANLPRSNNSIEGWHNAFAKRVAIVHPSVSKLTEKIRREQSKFELDIAQIRQGQEPKPKKLKYRKLDERIKRLVDDYHNLDLEKTDNAQITENSDDKDVIDNEIDEKTIALKLKNGKGWIKNRKKKKIIRYRNFKLHQHPENYYREQLMLFLPWINEEEILININHEETFELYKDLIQQKRSEYVLREVNQFEQAVEDHTERENENDIDDKNIEYDDEKNEFLIYEIGNNEGDIFVEMGINT
ncbi:unnamed protein product [Rotaria magnacalcarata]